MLQREIEDFLPAHPVNYFRDCVHRQDYVSPLAKPLCGGAEQQWCIYMFVWERGSSIYRVNWSFKTTLILSCSPGRTVRGDSSLSRGWLWGCRMGRRCCIIINLSVETLGAGGKGEQGHEAVWTVSTRMSAGSLASPRVMRPPKPVFFVW